MRVWIKIILILNFYVLDIKSVELRYFKKYSQVMRKFICQKGRKPGFFNGRIYFQIQ